MGADARSSTSCSATSLLLLLLLSAAAGASLAAAVAAGLPAAPLSPPPLLVLLLSPPPSSIAAMSCGGRMTVKGDTGCCNAVQPCRAAMARHASRYCGCGMGQGRAVVAAQQCALAGCTLAQAAFLTALTAVFTPHPQHTSCPPHPPTNLPTHANSPPALSTSYTPTRPVHLLSTHPPYPTLPG